MTTRRFRRITVAAGCIAAALAVPAVATTAMSLTVLESTIDFGRVTSDGSTAMPLPLHFMVQSGEPWKLALTTDACDAVPAFAGLPCHDAVEARSPGNEWRTLISGVPTWIAAGAAAPPSAPEQMIELLVKPAWTTAPGTHRVRLRCTVDRQSAAVELRYEVPVQMRLDSADAVFQSPHVNPAQSDVYMYEPRPYTVVSNVPWKLEVSLPAPLQAQASTVVLNADRLRIAADDGPLQKLVAGAAPLVVASGGPTAPDGKPVVLKLGVSVVGGEVGAVYAGSIAVAVRPQTITNTAAAKR